MALVKPLPLTRLNFLFLGDTTLLIWARASDADVGHIALRLGDAFQDIPIAYLEADGHRHIAALLTHDEISLGAESSLELLQHGHTLASFQGPLQEGNALARLQQFFSGMSAPEQSAFFGWLTSLAGGPQMPEPSPRYRQCCLQLLAQMNTPGFQVTHSFLLSPNLLYLEGEAQSVAPLGELGMLCLSDETLLRAPAYYHRLSESRYGLFAVFPDTMDVSARFLCLTQGHSVPVQGPRPASPSMQDAIGFFNAKPPREKRDLSVMLCRALLTHASKDSVTPAREWLDALQYYLEFPLTHCTNPQEPFNINFEIIFPLGTQGVFLCGWMRDPYHMLESIDIHTLGFSFPLGEHFFRTKRPDVTEAFANSPHGGFGEDAGFIAFAPIPEKISAQLDRAEVEMRDLRFTVTLRGGITYDIQPERHFRDAFSARDAVLKLIPSAQVSDAMLEQCLGPAAAILQRIAMQEVGIRATYEMEPQVEAPRVSLVIPLYKRLDFIKAQFATMASDPAMGECEVVYVLDSPWQEPEARELLREYAHLYQLPVKLIVMNRNSGYAAASNTGANASRGEFIVLLNSDVFPAGKGWTQRMADFYAAKKKTVGALAPKLLYEDDSLQHAGMLFAKTTFPDWINLHYYKGYPRNYAPASISRPVPAVTGACLMISRERWEEVGGLAVDYVVGDFEDSDLCLKCAESGYENWYFAEAELYHLERQSVPLNESYTDSLAWRYNARVHTRRWDTLIARLMKTHGDA